MNEQNPEAILRRKVALAAKGRTPGKTLSSALVQAIDHMFGVSVVVEDVVHQMQPAEDLVSASCHGELVDS